LKQIVGDDEDGHAIVDNGDGTQTNTSNGDSTVLGSPTTFEEKRQKFEEEMSNATTTFDTVAAAVLAGLTKIRREEFVASNSPYGKTTVPLSQATRLSSMPYKPIPGLNDLPGMKTLAGISNTMTGLSIATAVIFTQLITQDQGLVAGARYAVKTTASIGAGILVGKRFGNPLKAAGAGAVTSEIVSQGFDYGYDLYDRFFGK
jgi:hypothetical protein